MGIIKSTSKSTVKSTSTKRSSSKKTTKKRRPTSSTVLYRSLYNRYGESHLVPHSKYISRSECFIALYLSFYYTVIQQFKIPGVSHVFDIYIPKYNLVIEYDGDRWHKDKKHDAEIDKIALTNGFKMLRIKESDYYKNGKTAYVKKLMSQYDQSMMTKHLTTFQKNILSDFWK